MLSLFGKCYDAAKPNVFERSGQPTGSNEPHQRGKQEHNPMTAVYCDWYVFGLRECFVGLVEGAKQGLSPSLFAQLIVGFRSANIANVNVW